MVINSKIKISKSYLSGKSCYELAKEYNCTPTHIHYILKKTNTPRRSLSEASYIYTHNKDYFKKIDTQEKAYILGLLYADGNISKNVLSISLQEKDKHILETIKACLSYTGPLRSVKKSGNRSPQWNLYITSTTLVKDLLTHGLFPNKGFHLTFPQISYNLCKHFIRGYFDGDGCIYSNPKNQDYLVSMVSTKEVLEYIRDIFIHELGLSRTKLYNPPKVKDKNLYILTYQGRNNVKLLRGFLYKNATIYLQRKYDKFFSI